MLKYISLRISHYGGFFQDMKTSKCWEIRDSPARKVWEGALAEP
jgi:hypothetical protein